MLFGFTEVSSARNSLFIDTECASSRLYVYTFLAKMALSGHRATAIPVNTIARYCNFVFFFSTQLHSIEMRYFGHSRVIPI